MAAITLTQDQSTEVDIQDLELVGKHKWCAQKIGKRFYAVTTYRDESGKYKRLYLHRLLMNPPEGLVVDHKDGDTLNNSRSNLRVCTHSQNCGAFHTLRTNKASKYRGVYYVPNGRRKWAASVASDSEQYYLGVYDTEQEAAKARDAKAQEIWGEFAMLNFPAEPKGDN